MQKRIRLPWIRLQRGWVDRGQPNPWQRARGGAKTTQRQPCRRPHRKRVALLRRQAQTCLTRRRRGQRSCACRALETQPTHEMRRPTGSASPPLRQGRQLSCTRLVCSPLQPKAIRGRNPLPKPGGRPVSSGRAASLAAPARPLLVIHFWRPARPRSQHPRQPPALRWVPALCTTHSATQHQSAHRQPVGLPCESRGLLGQSLSDVRAVPAVPWPSRPSVLPFPRRVDPRACRAHATEPAGFRPSPPAAALG